MDIKFINKEYIALVLIEAKKQMFNQEFVTISELNQFSHYLQQEINDKNLNLVIAPNTLNSEDFNIFDGIIKKSSNCAFDLELLPLDILNIFYDTNLITNFLIKLEQEKIEILEKTKKLNYKL